MNMQNSASVSGWHVYRANNTSDRIRDNGASGIHWDVIARSLPGRNNRDVRKRWTNVLKNTYNRGPWTATEDEKLRNAVNQYDTRYKKLEPKMSIRCFILTVSRQMGCCR